jgi:hypothetical protein
LILLISTVLGLSCYDEITYKALVGLVKVWFYDLGFDTAYYGGAS